jgi:hypothetical protein
MYDQSLMKPKKCFNRKCKTPFFKEDVIGYAPYNHTTVLCLIRCPSCKDVFAVKQIVSIIHEYARELPAKPKIIRPKMSPITDSEIESVKKKMEEVNILQEITLDGEN